MGIPTEYAPHTESVLAVLLVHDGLLVHTANPARIVLHFTKWRLDLHRCWIHGPITGFPQRIDLLPTVGWLPPV